MKREKIIENEKIYIQIPYYEEDGKTTVFPEYVMNILENTKIEGMSKAIKRNVKGETYLWFHTTSYITMKEKFNREYLDTNAFCQFFEELMQVYECMQTYLLDKNLICLEPEYIFFDEKERKYVFLAIGAEEKSVLDSFESLFTFFADICSVEERKLLEFIFEAFTDLDRTNFQEMCFLGEIKKLKYNQKKQVELIEDNFEEEFEEESESMEVPKIKGTFIVAILLLLSAFYFSYMCNGEFRYVVTGMTTCILAVGLIGCEVFKKLRENFKKRST